jgi:hypothetical protein
MIIKFKIFEHIDIDPYGEEEWGEEKYIYGRDVYNMFRGNEYYLEDIEKYLEEQLLGKKIEAYGRYYEVTFIVQNDEDRFKIWLTHDANKERYRKLHDDAKAWDFPGDFSIEFDEGSALKIKEDISEAIRWYKNGKLELDTTHEEPTVRDEIINDDEFRKFLIQNDAYDKFLNTIEKIGRKGFSLRYGDERYRYISVAFTWSDSSDGDFYWRFLSDKWQKYLREHISEAIRWYKQGKLGPAEKEENDESTKGYNKIFDYINKDENHLKDTIEIKISEWPNFCKFLDEHNIVWNGRQSSSDYAPSPAENAYDKYHISFFYKNGNKEDIRMKSNRINHENLIEL